MESGLLILDKPASCTSRDMVDAVGKVYKTRKVGHAGTLDPMATGVLVIAVNDALKILEFLSCEEKEYIGEAKLGFLTDTLDTTGTVLTRNYSFTVTEEDIRKVFLSFPRKYLQEVPLYSSVRVGGKRLYQYAREQKEVVLPKREVEIFELELLDFSLESASFSFRARVSKGTYIRSLVRDIGKMLGVDCTMSRLRRTRQGSFDEADSFSLEEVENHACSLISIKEALSCYPMVEADSTLEEKILNGSLLENRYGDFPFVFVNSQEEVLAIYGKYDKDATKVKPIKMIKRRDVDGIKENDRVSSL